MIAPQLATHQVARLDQLNTANGHFFCRMACACSGMLIESKQCKSSACPVQCVQYWGNWGSCSATCGINSVQSRLRIIKQVPTNGALRNLQRDQALHHVGRHKMPRRLRVH